MNRQQQMQDILKETVEYYAKDPANRRSIDKDGNCNYILIFDSEGSIDTEFVRKLGVDISRVRVQLISTIEEFNHIAAQINKSFEDTIAAGKKPPKIMIILDSLGNLSTLKEMTDSTEGIDKRDMTKQQGIRKMFRVNGTKFAKHGIPFIVNNHVYAAIDESLLR